MIFRPQRPVIKSQGSSRAKQGIGQPMMMVGDDDVVEARDERKMEGCPYRI